MRVSIIFTYFRGLIMDRNTIIGFSLIFLILVGYYWWASPSPEVLALEQRKQDSLAKIEKMQQATAKKASLSATEKSDSANVKNSKNDSSRLNSRFGGFAPSFGGKDSLVSISNKSVTATFSTKGGRLVEVKLNGYKRADSTPLVLLEKQGHDYHYEISLRDTVLRTSEFQWSIAEKTNNKVTFMLPNGKGGYLEQSYILGAQNFVLDYKFSAHKLSADLLTTDVKLVWNALLHKQEKEMQFESQYSTIVYKTAEEHPEFLSERTPEKTDKIPGKTQWVSFKQQYFNASLISRDGFTSGESRFEWKETNLPNKVKDMRAELYLPFKNEEDKVWNMAFYFGPNSYKTLQNLNVGIDNHELQRIVPLGWGIFGWVNRWLVIPVFNFLLGKVGSMGILILLLTLIIKFVLLPLVYRSYISTAKMRILKPEIDEIKNKYGDDMQKIQVENLALYKKAGVNPMSGCVPMLLQMPILFAMFQFFPVLFELRQESFLWSKDLSAYDSILDLGFNIPFYGSHVSLFTLLMTISTLIYTHLNNQISGITGQMKWIGYIMPIIFLGVLNSYPSGLTWYYFVSNMVTFGQQFAIRRLVDDAKLHAQIAEARKKPVKKSNFSKRLEEVMKAQQQKSKQTGKKSGPPNRKK
jgi:YidC/Oxa1 family membrane protein insertase